LKARKPVTHEDKIQLRVQNLERERFKRNINRSNKADSWQQPKKLYNA